MPPIGKIANSLKKFQLRNILGDPNTNDDPLEREAEPSATQSHNAADGFGISADTFQNLADTRASLTEGSAMAYEGLKSGLMRTKVSAAGKTAAEIRIIARAPYYKSHT